MYEKTLDVGGGERKEDEGFLPCDCCEAKEQTNQKKGWPQIFAPLRPQLLKFLLDSKDVGVIEHLFRHWQEVRPAGTPPPE